MMITRVIISHAELRTALPDIRVLQGLDTL